MLVLAVVPAVAEATQLAVVNAGFESPPLAANGSTAGSIPGWTGDFGANYGVWRPTAADFPGLAPEGLNVGWASSAGFSQTLTATVQPWTTYTLSVKVGRWEIDTQEQYSLALKAGGSTLASFSEALAAIPRHAFVERTVTFSTTDAGPGMGQPLTIVLAKPTFRETDFDDVRLVATPVPEAQTYAMLLAGLGLLGSAGMRRRRAAGTR